MSDHDPVYSCFFDGCGHLATTRWKRGEVLRLACNLHAGNFGRLNFELEEILPPTDGVAWSAGVFLLRSLLSRALGHTVEVLGLVELLGQANVALESVVDVRGREVVAIVVRRRGGSAESPPVLGRSQGRPAGAR